MFNWSQYQDGLDSGNILLFCSKSNARPVQQPTDAMPWGAPRRMPNGGHWVPNAMHLVFLNCVTFLKALGALEPRSIPIFPYQSALTCRALANTQTQCICYKTCSKIEQHCWLRLPDSDYDFCKALPSLMRSIQVIPVKEIDQVF